jgi:5-methylcytosine-specific restriction protein A
MPQRICGAPMCRERVQLPATYCAKHSGLSDKQYNKHVRTNDFNAKYNAFYKSAQWTKTRKAKLMEQPLCEVCANEGRLTRADMVHHIIELRSPNGWEHRLDMNNLESICYSCHNKEEHLSLIHISEPTRP